MSEAAERILDLPARQVFGTEIEFLNPKTKRKKLAVIRGVYAWGVVGKTRDELGLPIRFNSITRISKEAQP